MLTAGPAFAVDPVPQPEKAPGFWAKNTIDWGVKVGAASYMLMDLDDETAGKPFRLPDPGDDVAFGVHRASIYVWGGWGKLAKLKLHLLSMPIKKPAPGVDLADAHLTLAFHPWAQVKIGKFKKTFTRVFQPQWFHWNFFDVPQAFMYTRSALGLGGRDYGLFVSGGKKNSIFRYQVGLFDGGHDASATSGVSNEGVQLVARVESKPLDYLTLGAGVTYQTAGKLTKTDATTGTVTVADQDTMAYAANVSFTMAGFDLDLEYIGSVIMPDEGDSVLGGGFYADARYRIKMPMGCLIPGVRAAMHSVDFDADKLETTAFTGSVYWQFQNNIRAGLEVTALDEQAKVPTVIDRQSTQALLQLQLIH